MAPVVSDFEAIRTVGAVQLRRFGLAGRQPHTELKVALWTRSETIASYGERSFPRDTARAMSQENLEIVRRAADAVKPARQSSVARPERSRCRIPSQPGVARKRMGPRPRGCGTSIVEILDV